MLKNEEIETNTSIELSGLFKTEKECVEDASFRVGESIKEKFMDLCTVSWNDENANKIMDYFSGIYTLRELDDHINTFYDYFKPKYREKTCQDPEFIIISIYE